MNDLAKWELVNTAKTRDQLKSAIREVSSDGIIGQHMAMAQINYVDKVLDGSENIERMTRAYGIRQQVLYLKHYNR